MLQGSKLYKWILLALIFLSLFPLLIRKKNVEFINKNVLLALPFSIFDKNTDLLTLKQSGINAFYFNENTLTEDFSNNEPSIKIALNEGFDLILVVNISRMTHEKYVALQSMISKISIKELAFLSDDTYNKATPVAIPENFLAYLEQNKIALELFEDAQQRSFLMKETYKQMIEKSSLNFSRTLFTKYSDTQDLSSLDTGLRQFRSVVDRGIRTILLDENLYVKKRLDTLDATKVLKENLIRQGYRLNNEPNVTEKFSLPTLSFYLLFFALYLTISMNLEFLLEKRIKNILNVAVFLALVTLSLLIEKNTLLRLLALGFSITFPLISILSLFHFENHFTQPLRMKCLFNVLFVFGLNVIGGLFISICFYSVEFSLGAQPFDFALFTYIIPILIIVFWFNFTQQPMIYKYQNNNVQLKRNAMIAFIILLIYLYLSRSIHLSLLPATPFELRIRMFLEQIFGTRPRTKEFFIGYPCLILMPLIDKVRNQPLRLLVICGSAITGISICNSFSHAFTPVTVSFQRSINGLFLGILCGTFAFYLVHFIIKRYDVNIKS